MGDIIHRTSIQLRKTMKYYLPTYQQCLIIAKAYDNFNFYETKFEIDGYKISSFSYRLAMYNDFCNPKNSDIPAYELRGISFVFNSDGTLYRRYPLLHKFFNLNQVEETQFHLLKDIPIKQIYEKADGSLACFIKLPNGKVIAKTKMSFDSDQSVNAMKIYESCEKLQILVNECLDNDILPIFEYVSPFNRVVVKYSDSRLVLLRLRDMNTGEYLSIDGVDYPDKVVKYKYSWDEMFSMIPTIKDFEGWVITLENGYDLKLKCDWYRELHQTMTESIYREDYIIQKVVDDEIDDIIGKIDNNDKEVLAMIDNITIIVNNYIKFTYNEVLKQINVLNSYPNIGEYAKLHKKDKYFHFVVNKEKDIIKNIKEHLLHNTRRLELARTFIQNRTL